VAEIILLRKNKGMIAGDRDVKNGEIFLIFALDF
jgi:hypothetical protein